MEALNVQDRANRLRFPELREAEAAGVRKVRNQPLEHPEKHYANSNAGEYPFAQNLILTHAGPVLRASAIAISSTTGESFPPEESVDKGLYVNASELRDVLEVQLAHAISSLKAS